MSKTYTLKTIQHLIADRYKVIVVLTDGSAHLGILNNGFGYGHFRVESLTINDGGMGFPRSMIKQIVVLPNGVIYPKDNTVTTKIKKLNIIELSELVNKAGYEFI